MTRLNLVVAFSVYSITDKFGVLQAELTTVTQIPSKCTKEFQHGTLLVLKVAGE